MGCFVLGGRDLACISGTALLGLRMPLDSGCASRCALSFVRFQMLCTYFVCPQLHLVCGAMGWPQHPSGAPSLLHFTECSLVGLAFGNWHSLHIAGLLLVGLVNTPALHLAWHELVGACMNLPVLLLAWHLLVGFITVIVWLHRPCLVTLLPPRLAIKPSARIKGALLPSHTFPALVPCVLLANLNTPCAVAVLIC